MANLNKINKNQIVTDKNTMLNHHGAVVHKLNILEEIFNRSKSSYLGENTYYEKTSPEAAFNHMKELVAALPQEDAEYVLKIAAISREMNIISYPLALLTICFNDEKFKGLNFADENGINKIGKYADSVIKRGRDITDILANQISIYGFDIVNGKRSNSLPKQLKKQLKRKLEEFDEYKIAKALGVNKEVSMADAVKLLHPSNKSEFFKSVIEENVKFANGKKQIQSEITKINNKNSNSSLTDVKESIANSSLLAIIKNLVALQRKDAIDDITANIIVEKLMNPEIVRKSRILPYEFYAAYMAFSMPGKNGLLIKNALSNAIDHSIVNLDDIEGYTAYFVDLSGSMRQSISFHSSISAMDMACILAAIGAKKSNARIYAFATSCKEVAYLKSSSVIEIANAIKASSVGASTYLIEALKAVEKSTEKFDNVIVLSDGDAYHYNEKMNVINLEGSCDAVCSKLLKSGFMKRFFINNLLLTNFTIVNTNEYKKNLISGFSEKYVDEINLNILLAHASSDIRNVINILYDKYCK